MGDISVSNGSPLTREGKRIIRENLYKELGVGETVALVAASRVGTKEESNRVSSYGKYFGYDTVLWCALFYHWCRCTAAVLRGDVVPVVEGEHAKSAYTFDNALFSDPDPKHALPGDALVWRTTGNPSQGHLAVVLENNTKRRMIMFVEPNVEAGEVLLATRCYDRLVLDKKESVGVCSYLRIDSPSGKKLFSGPGFFNL